MESGGYVPSCEAKTVTCDSRAQKDALNSFDPTAVTIFLGMNSVHVVEYGKLGREIRSLSSQSERNPLF